MPTDREIALEQALVAVLGAAQDLDLDLVKISQSQDADHGQLKVPAGGAPARTNAWNEVEAAILAVRKA